MSRATSKTFVRSPPVLLKLASEPAYGALVSALRDGSGTLAVEVGHDADVALVAPFGGVVYAHAHDIRVVGGIPRLGHGLAQQAPYARGLSRAAAALSPPRSCQRAPSLIACALKSAVKCVFGRTFQGILVACTPSLGQSALSSAQCTIVSYCQMLRCHKVLSRVS
ncbi:MAG: hypothetical protein DUD39_08140 [Coriobacteriaceae bacterium]|nr:MAG: hypothetical protein DUD39_08140 [Coriobacteriaceae bacterium]